MKELCLCNCCARKGARYVTPWCELLTGKDNSSSVLHLWYKLDMFSEEVKKRTSILGKLRRTEESKHLLDLIAMTEDEKPMFYPLAKAAMSDIFDVLHAFMPKQEKALWWREGLDTVIINDTPEPEPEPETEDIQDEAESEPEPEPEPPTPIEFKAGQYVMYNGELFMAIEDGDSNNMAGKLVPTEDYRDSIHYGIIWRCGSNINAVEPLDVAIFEALVARVIFKWLEYSYPDEAVRYLNEYNELCAKIRSRANILDGPKIVRRIPRP